MISRGKTIRIVVADSNQMSCELLSEALAKRPGISIAASVADGESMLRSTHALKPDVVLVSAALQDGPVNVMSISQAVSSRTPECPWVLMLDQTEAQVVVSAFRAGAMGVFSRAQSDVNLLAKCIRKVAEGEIWVDNKQMLYLVEAVTLKEPEPAATASVHCQLTPREESVVRLVVQGMVNREIADTLRLSEHTIKNYLFRIFDKLGVSNRVELALYAVAKLNLSDCNAA
jgi:DNA-binding NarL/FixJ family response regulator